MSVFGHFNAHPAEEHLMAVAASVPNAEPIVRQARSLGIGWKTILQYIFSPNGLQLLATLIAALLTPAPTPPTPTPPIPAT